MLEPAAEYELLTCLIQGDRKAFDQIYHAYVQPVYANALKLTGNTLLAEDVVQEVFVALWEKRAGIDATRSVAGWLFVVCYNKSVSLLKKQLQESVALRELSFVRSSTDEAAKTEMQWQILEHAVQSLSPQKRKVFELCKLQGKSYEEAASHLQISRHTVKEYLSAAVAYVKEYAHLHPGSSVTTALGFFFFL